MTKIDESFKTDTGIKDCYLQPLQIIRTDGGPVLHMLRADFALMPEFPQKFGEIYFSEVLPGKIKAWKKHRIQNQLFAVPIGEIRIALYDVREDSPTLGVLSELDLGRPDNYKLLRIPAGVWYGFTALRKSPALICNCADIRHDPEECMRLPYNSDKIPYSWDADQCGVQRQ